MENIQQKAEFLHHEYTKVLSRLSADAPRRWGKMSVQQMIEHMSEYIRIASGRVAMTTLTPAEQLPRMQGFLASEKPFRENTPNVLMPEEPAPAKHATLQVAIDELQMEIDHFFDVHEKDTSKVTANPFFGDLNFEQQVQLLYKHAIHHLKQFGAAE